MRITRLSQVLASFLTALLVPTLALAQGSTGAIAGNVKDTTGAALPGVTVEVASPALIEKTRTAVSDGEGNYKITELRPGVYTVTFTLAGFSVVRREGIELTAGFTAPVNAELKVGSVSETITVTAASPVVDIQTPRTQQLLKQEVLDVLPSGMKDLTQMVTLTLGATTSTLHNDVGGNQGELSTGIAIHGSKGDDSRTNYDGFNTNVFYGGAGGQQRIYKFNTIGVAESVIDTGSSAADTETGGANVNMVPKDGGNRFSILGSLNYTGNSLSDGQLPSDLIARQLPTDPTNSNSLKKVYDYGVGIGGPIMPDKVWFYSADRWWGNQGYAANNYFNNSPLFYKLQFDKSRPAYSDQYYKDYGGRVTWQATTKQKFTFSENWQSACACYMSVGGTAAPESVQSFIYGPEKLTQVTWTYPYTSRLLFQSGFSYLRQMVQFTSKGGSGAPGQLTITDSNYPGVGAYTWGGLTASVQNDNGIPQQNDNLGYRASMSYITGSHAIKTGLQGQWGMYNTRGNTVPAGITYTFNGGVPISLTESATPFLSDGRITNLGLYVQDQWTLKRLTLSYGVRYDHFNARTLPITLPAGPFRPQESFAAADNIPNYNDITPRIGAAFDVFGNGKTAIKGAWGRYLIGLGGGSLTTLSPSNSIATTTTRPWSDNAFPAGDPRNGNFLPDCVLTNALANGECGQISNFSFGSPVTNVTWDPRAAAGWGVREYNNQWSISLQQEVRPSFGVSAGFYHTAWENAQVQVSQALSASSFDYYCVTAPSDPRLGAASGQQVCGLTNVNFANKSTAPQNVWMRAKDVPGLAGQRTDVYNGGDLSLNWRFKKTGVLAGGLSIGRETVNNCYLNSFPNITAFVSAAAATTIGTGTATSGTRDPKYCQFQTPWWNGVGSQVKLQVVYPLPYDFIISGVFKNLPGIAISGTVTYPDAAIAPSLGRNLSACAAPTGACTQTASVNVVLPGGLYDQRLNEADARLTRRFKVGRGHLNGILELYNVFNSRVPQSDTTTWGTAATPGSAAVPGTTFLRPSLYLGGRLLKFGAQLDW